MWRAVNLIGGPALAWPPLPLQMKMNANPALVVQEGGNASTIWAPTDAAVTKATRRWSTKGRSLVLVSDDLAGSSPGASS